jgi:hypothetical protein
MAVGRLERPKALAFEVFDNDLADDRLVVDDQDGGHIGIVMNGPLRKAEKCLDGLLEEISPSCNAPVAAA